jgi:D-xylose 1-dehydrogenase (NADP+, D-xylono-1,5-lactone-forming)
MKSIGVIGPGAHFKKKIFPVLVKSNFFKLSGILRKNKIIKFKNIQNFSEDEFFKKNFDFVYISCPNILHEQFIIRSLNTGSHVICEKPFLVRNKNINRIMKIANKKNKLIFESFMYIYHPAFKFIKNAILKKKYGKLNYLISNFRFPSLEKKNNRYKNNEGAGFFYDSACYLVSLENILFKKKASNKIIKQKIINNVDLRGNIFINSDECCRFYFWGEGQNYSNKIEIFFEKATIHIDKFFSKNENEIIVADIHTTKKKSIEFKKVNQFEQMFDQIKKNYKKKTFQTFHSNMIKKQLNLMLKLI